MSKALKLTGGREASETAKFVEMMDKFFDSMNVRNYTEGVHKRKRFRMPYTTSEDMRLRVCIQYYYTYVFTLDPDLALFSIFSGLRMSSFPISTSGRSLWMLCLAWLRPSGTAGYSVWRRGLDWGWHVSFSWVFWIVTLICCYFNNTCR